MEDHEEFLQDLRSYLQTYGMSLDEVRQALPSTLRDDDILWIRRESGHWTSYQDFLDAF